MKNLQAPEDDKLHEFKEEMFKTIDKKTDSNQRDTWKSKCNALFDEYIFKVKEMKKSVILLKKQIKDAKGVITKVPNATKEKIRNSFISLFESANEIVNFCKDQKFVNQVIDIYMQAILLQCVCAIELCSFWYQIDLDKDYILGVEGTKDQERVKSMKEEYHDIMAECLSKITPAVYKNIRDKNDNLNKYYQDNAHVFLEANQWLYPVPLVVAPLKIPRIPTKLYLKSSTPTINVPFRKTPFIYRIDGANMLPDQEEEGKWGYRLIPKVDPLTKCHGTLIEKSNTLHLNFQKKKDVVVRIFGLYPKEIDAIIIGKENFIMDTPHSRMITQPLCCLPVMFEKPKPFNDEKLNRSTEERITQTESSYLESNGGRSGFTYLSQHKNVSRISLNISQNINSMFSNSKGCVKFIELIITDPTQH